MITEHLMRPGSGSFQLKASTPAEITSLIGDLIGPTGVGCELVITPTRLNSTTIGDAAVLDQAIYAGEIVDRDSRTQYQVTGLASLLDGVNTTTITRTTGTPAQWVGDVAANGLTTGTGTGGSNVTRTFPRLAQTRREILDAVAALGGWEWDISPAGEINYGTALFTSPPSVVITDHDAGPDALFRGVEGGILGHGITASALASAVYVIGSGTGAVTVEGSDTQTLSRKGRAGGTLTLATTISAPAEGSTANADALAAAALAQRVPRYSVDVSSNTRHTRRFLRAGDEVYLWSIKGGLTDPSIQVRFRGQIITPVLVRCLTITWPIERGYGVYIRTNAASPVYTDISQYIEWEEPGTWLEVGDWAPASYGVTGRSNPAIEERLAGDIPVSVTSGATAGTNWSVVSLEAHVSAEFLQFLIIVERTTSGLVIPDTTGNITNETVATLPTSCRGNITYGVPVSTGSTGRGVFATYIPSSGQVRLNALGSPDDITVGEQFSIGGFVRINA